MKRIYYVIFLGLFLSACKTDFDGMLDPQTASPVVISLTGINSFTITPGDSIINFRIALSNFSSVSAVYAEVYNSANQRVSPFPLGLYDNGSGANGDAVQGDGIYSNLMKFSTTFINGIYTVNYYVTVNGAGTQRAGSENLNFNNGTSNIAPVIHSVIAPDTVTVVDTVAFIVKAVVSDSNGAGDIERVTFQTFRPDGSTNGALLDMNDAGRDGDETAGDGIYSLGVRVFASNQKGTYRFEFIAKDRGKLSSIPYNHLITIK